MKTLMRIGLCLLLAWIFFAQACMRFRTPDKTAVAEFAEKGLLLKTEAKKIEGHTIHFVQTGPDSLPTIVFIHGTPGSWTAFEAYLKDSLLLSKYRLVSFDRPGFGYSDFGDALHLEEQAALMGPVIKSLKNGQPLWLAGHSLGGPMVLELALDFPALADGLVIIAGSIDPAAEKPEKWRPILFNTPLNYLVPGAMRPSNEELWFLKSDLKKLEQKLSAVRCPVYFIHGTKDSWVPPSNVAYGLKHLTNATKMDTVWLNGNHFIPWTKFDAVRKLLMELPKHPDL